MNTTAPCDSGIVDWSPYYRKIPKVPSFIARTGLPFVSTCTSALDIGCGAMNDTVLMLNNGFSRVEAIDSSEASEVYAKGLENRFPNRFSFKRTTFKDHEYGTRRYDWVNANFSLPYQQGFEDLLVVIAKSLKFKGIFSGTFLGPHDEEYWMHSNFFTITKEDLRALFTALELTLLTLEECEIDTTFFDGHMKHWHYHRVIAMK